ncbi:MAG: type II secretion system protein [Candidatus Gastranaerophilales bacterium]|nr:type II secretion system protein [Candidatus Gastranaerophilales bacterium]
MCKKTINKKYLAFTLAEVLIALLIIGVIASIVISGLINDSKGAEYTTVLKKVYAELTQATLQIQSPGSDVTIPSTNDPIGVRTAYGSVVHFIKTDIAGNIWGTVGVGTTSIYRNYKGTAPAYMHIFSSSPAAILTNGTFIGFTSGYRVTQGFHEIYFDTNGSKGPNMMGMDVHKLLLIDINGYYKLLPVGASGATQWPIWGTAGQCTANSTTWTTSWPCTFLRLTDPDHMP